MLEGNFISLVAQDNGTEARQVLQDDLSARVLDHLEDRKRDLAKGLFAGATEQVTEAKVRPHKDPEKGWVGQSKAYYAAIAKKRGKDTPEDVIKREQQYKK